MCRGVNDGSLITTTSVCKLVGRFGVIYGRLAPETRRHPREKILLAIREIEHHDLADQNIRSNHYLRSFV